MTPEGALKLAEVANPATVMDAGTVRAVLLLFRATMAPPPGADAVSKTVQVALLLALSVAGTQDSELTVGKATPTVPPVAETAMASPAGDDAKPPVTPTAVP